MSFLDKLFGKKQKEVKKDLLEEYKLDERRANMFLSDADTFMTEMNNHSLNFINSPLYEEIKNKLSELKFKWVSATPNEIATIYNEYYRLQSLYKNYIEGPGKVELIEYRIKTLIEATKMIKENSELNRKSYKELMLDFGKLKASIDNVPEIRDHHQILNILDETEFYVQKNAITLARKNRDINIPNGLLSKFKNQIQKEALKFINSIQSDQKMIELQNSIRVLVAFNNLNDLSQIGKLFALLIETNEEFAFDKEEKPDIELTLIPNNSPVGINDIEEKLKELCEKIRPIQLVDLDKFNELLKKVTDFKLKFYSNPNDGSLVSEFKIISSEYIEYMNQKGLVIMHSKQVDATLERIKSIGTEEALSSLIKELLTDQSLKNSPEIIKALNDKVNMIKANRYSLYKKQNNFKIKNITDFSNLIVNDAKIIISDETRNKLNEFELQIIDDIKNILNLPMDEFNLLRLYSYVKIYSTKKIDPFQFEEAYRLFSPLVFESFGHESDHLGITLINQETKQKSLTSMMTNDTTINSYYSSMFGHYSFYKSFLKGPDLIKKTGELIKLELLKNNSLLPNSLLNGKIGPELKEVKEEISMVMFKFFYNNKILINSFDNEDTFAKVLVILSDYQDKSDVNNTVKAKNYLVNLFPNLSVVIDGVLDALNIFYAYYLDLEMMDQEYTRTINKTYGVIENTLK